MQLLVQTAMIFFGTLMAAGLVALGEPVDGASSASDSAGSLRRGTAQPQQDQPQRIEVASRAAFGSR